MYQPGLPHLGDEAVESLIEGVRCHMSTMFKICEAVALLDMVRAAQRYLITC